MSPLIVIILYSVFCILQRLRSMVITWDRKTKGPSIIWRVYSKFFVLYPRDKCRTAKLSKALAVVLCQDIAWTAIKLTGWKSEFSSTSPFIISGNVPGAEIEDCAGIFKWQSWPLLLGRTELRNVNGRDSNQILPQEKLVNCGNFSNSVKYKTD